MQACNSQVTTIECNPPSIAERARVFRRLTRGRIWRTRRGAPGFRTVEFRSRPICDNEPEFVKLTKVCRPEGERTDGICRGLEIERIVGIDVWNLIISDHGDPASGWVDLDQSARRIWVVIHPGVGEQSAVRPHVEVTQRNTIEIGVVHYCFKSSANRVPHGNGSAGGDVKCHIPEREGGDMEVELLKIDESRHGEDFGSTHTLIADRANVILHESSNRGDRLEPNQRVRGHRLERCVDR